MSPKAYMAGAEVFEEPEPAPAPGEPPLPNYYCGLDLGQARDFTALTILEQHGSGPKSVFHARHLQRFPLGTAYPTIVTEVVRILQREPLRWAHSTLLIDGTGVGRPVVDMFCRECASLPHTVLRSVIITGGDTVTEEGGIYRVPKRDLVGAVQVVLQNQRLKIAASLPEAATLVKELQNFQVKITTAANDTYGAWREGTHDDLVLAVALALWGGNRPKPVFSISDGSGYVSPTMGVNDIIANIRRMNREQNGMS